jgi:heat shock protein HslJ
MVLVAAAVLVVAGIVGAAVQLARGPDSDRVRTTASSTTTTVDTYSPGAVPRDLYGGWIVTSFDDGPGSPELITWDPRHLLTVGFNNVLPDQPGRLSFGWGPCGPSLAIIELHGDQIQVVADSVIYPPPCTPSAPETTTSPKAEDLLRTATDLRYAIRDGVLRLADSSAGWSLTAEREEAVDAPLPADLVTPAVLYGEWVATSWADAKGTHVLDPPEGSNPFITFGESQLGAFLGYGADCNGSTASVGHYTEDRIVLKEHNGFGSTSMGCASADGGPPWSFPQVRQLFASADPVRWKVSGSTLTLSGDGGLTITAQRVGRTYRSAK